ncbi:MAG: beta-ketoacyl-[acyl-carrier-protein] synthase family protein [Bacteroidales bacterium]|nr:beta-ketoacyl-[acyl-carrier-protein] synthase family protein [Bacteroidales bacterium]
MKTDSKKRVVITGIGPVTSVGIGKDEFWNSLLSKKMNVCKIPERFEKSYSFKSKFYVPFPEISLKDFGIPSKYNVIMEETSKLSVIGTELALKDAGFKMKKNEVSGYECLKDAVVILGMGICSLKAGFNAFASHTFYDTPDLLEKFDISPKYNRMVIPLIMPDSAASWVTILYNINGANFTLNTSCASGTYAVGEAFRRIRDGYAGMAITGGVECLMDNSGTIMRGFDTLGTLTKSENGIPMPFSKKRSGFLFSEGAGCILLLEELESAQQRGADIYAEIINYECSSDAYNIVQIEKSGALIKKLLNKIIGTNKIDYFNTHGTATLLNDEVEYNIIKEVFGNKSNQPVINSTKGILGHSIGASGAIEVAVTALSIKNSKVHANVSEDTFEDMNLADEAIDTNIDYALTASYGFGGHNAAILLKKL